MSEVAIYNDSIELGNVMIKHPERDVNDIYDASWSSFELGKDDFYMQYFTATQQQGAEYTFLGAYICREVFGLQYAYTEDFLCIRSLRDNTLWAPLGDWCAIDWTKYPLSQMSSSFQYVPEELAKLWVNIYGDKVSLVEDRDSWDYIYLASDLAELSGRKYSKKKNHLNHFFKTISDYRVEEITVDNAHLIAIEYERWVAQQCDLTPYLYAEYKAICDILYSWEKLPRLQGVVIFIGDDAVASFAIGEALSSTTFVIHIEKSLQERRGLYQFINQAFAERIKEQGYLYINRSDDLGILGLRQAKLSYYPVDFLKKYTVHFL